jgi:YT521-B-like domain
MTSPILKDAAEVYRQTPSTEVTPEPANAPRTIPTVATETAPRGRIIDDSARGTIFWEAELTDEEEDESTAADDPPPVEASAEADPSSQVWGKPFRVEWLSTVRLPFYRTRGLRNPWNANREVKIARDGTELETNVGKRLVQMFHRMGPPAGGVGISPAQMQIPLFGGGMPGPSQQFYRQ